MPLVQELPIEIPLNQDQVIRAHQIMVSHYRWPDQKISVEEFRASLSRLNNPYLHDIVDLVYQYHLARENKVRWGDKTPPYIKILPELKALYPNAKFIFMVRDGHDVANSFYAQKWIGRWLHTNTQEWKEASKYYREHQKLITEADILEVKYERLVLEMEKTIQTICQFLHENYEPAMLSWQKELPEKIPKREAGIHTKLYRMPRATDVYRWRREQSPLSTLIVEAYLYRELAQHGYSRRYKSRISILVFSLVRLFCEFGLPFLVSLKAVASLGVDQLRKFSPRSLSKKESLKNAPQQSSKDKF